MLISSGRASVIQAENMHFGFKESDKTFSYILFIKETENPKAKHTHQRDIWAFLPAYPSQRCSRVPDLASGSKRIASPHGSLLLYFLPQPEDIPEVPLKVLSPRRHRGKTQNWRRSDFHLSSLRQPGNLLPPRLPRLKGDHHKYCHPEGTPGGMA